MKGIVCIFCCLVLITSVVVFASEKPLETTNYPSDIMEGVVGTHDHALTEVRAESGEIFVRLKKVKFTPQGVDTKGKDLKSFSSVYVFSGIMDMMGMRQPFASVPVSSSGEAEFRFPNLAALKGVPIVEHLWGRSGPDPNPKRSLALVHDPEDPWVVQGLTDGKKDLNKLAIGVLMCPNGTVKPLKPLGLGKIAQGLHPELSSQCSK